VILRRDAAPRRAADPVDPTSVPDLARTLRQTRLQRGLDLDGASAACGVPVAQLEDFEAGTVSRLPDRVAVLKGLRRYADSLDLPGERFVLVMVEHWPDDEVVTSSVGALGATGEVVAVAAGSAAPTTVAGPEVGGLFLVPDTLTTTAALPAQPAVTGLPSAQVATATNGGIAWAGNGTSGDASTDQVPLVLADTGVTPAVRAWRPSVGSLGADSVAIEYLCGFLAVLLVIGGAWLGVNHWRPQWLRTIHVPYTSKPLPLAAGPRPTTTPTSASPAGRGVGTPTTAPHVAPTTAPSRAAKGLGGGPALRLTSVTGDHATFAVRATTFTVRVHCVGGDAWVQVSGSTPTPVYAQVVPANGTKDFHGRAQLTMLIGSSAARLTILHGTHVIGTYTPPSAPFSMTFTSTG
jgi:hypothetical protein